MEIWTPGFLWNPKIHVYDIHGLHGHVHRTDSLPTTDETRGGHLIGAKISLTSEAKRKLRLALCTSKLLLTGGLVPFTRRLGLSSTIFLSKRPLLIRLSLTRLLFLLLQECLELNLARIRLKPYLHDKTCLIRLCLIRLCHIRFLRLHSNTNLI